MIRLKGARMIAARFDPATGILDSDDSGILDSDDSGGDTGRGNLLSADPPAGLLRVRVRLPRPGARAGGPAAGKGVSRA